MLQWPEKQMMPLTGNCTWPALNEGRRTGHTFTKDTRGCIPKLEVVLHISCNESNQIWFSCSDGNSSPKRGLQTRAKSQWQGTIRRSIPERDRIPPTLQWSESGMLLQQELKTWAYSCHDKFALYSQKKCRRKPILRWMELELMFLQGPKSWAQARAATTCIHLLGTKLHCIPNGLVGLWF